MKFLIIILSRDFLKDRPRMHLLHLHFLHLAWRYHKRKRYQSKEQWSLLLSRWDWKHGISNYHPLKIGTRCREEPLIREGNSQSLVYFRACRPSPDSFIFYFETNVSTPSSNEFSLTISQIRLTSTYQNSFFTSWSVRIWTSYGRNLKVARHRGIK